jgi:hypothetical protein
MKISIQNKAGQTFLLCDGPNKLEAWSNAPQWQVDVSTPFRATSARPLRAHNCVRKISFRVTREHGNFMLAQAYELDHAADLIPFGIVTFTCRGGAGNAEQAFHALAGIESAPGEIIGVTTIHTYTLTCGAVTRTRPTFP